MDEDVITEIAVHQGKSRVAVRQAVCEWKYDYLTSTYFLLSMRKIKGRSVRLLPKITHIGDIKSRTPARSLMDQLNKEKLEAAIHPASIATSPRSLHTSLEGGLNNNELLSMGGKLPEDEDGKFFSFF